MMKRRRGFGLVCWGVVVAGVVLLPTPGAGAADAQPVVQISASADVVTPGTAFSYLVQITGTDDSEMTATDLTVSVPEGADVSGLPEDCADNGPTVNCDLGTIAAGGTASASVRLVMDPSLSKGAVTANAQLTCTECTQFVGASATTPMAPQADLTLALDAPSAVPAGQQAGYSVHVENLGPSTASGVTIVDRPPAPLRFAGGDGCSADGAKVTCRVGRLGPGQRLTRVLQVTAPDDVGTSRQVEDSATVTSQTPDPDGNNNSDTASTTLRDDARLSASTRTSAVAITPGTEFSYTTDVRNHGPSPAKQVRVQSHLPEGLRPVAIRPANAGCALTASTVTCRIPELAEGAKTSIVIRAEPDPVMPAGRAEAATVVSCQDCGPAHQFKTARRVRPEADLNVAAAVDHGHLEPGDRATYSVSLTNKGPSTATQLKVTDSLPGGLSLEKAAGCTAAGQNVTCALGRLDPGQRHDWRITARADGKIKRKISLVDRVHATMASSIHDPDPKTENTAVTTVEEPGETWKLWVIGGCVIAGLAAIAAWVFRYRRSHKAPR